MKLPYGIPEQALYIGGAVLLSWLLSALWAIRMRRKYKAMFANERAARAKAEQAVAVERQRTIRATQEAAHPTTPANPAVPPVRIVRAPAKPKPKKAAAKAPPKRAPKNRPTRFDRIDDD